jgi:type II secretory pathway pseudopilin PulG
VSAIWISRSGTRGFSLVEILVATAVTLSVAAAVLAAVAPSQSAFTVQTETSDMQQRLRVATDALRRELEGAGAGPSSGPFEGPTHRVFAGVLPHRIGVLPGPGHVEGEVLSILTVPATFAQTTLASPLMPGATAALIQLDPGCPLGVPACGFTVGMTVAVFDGTGALDVFRVTGVDGVRAALEPANERSLRVYGAGSGIAEIHVRTLSRQRDAAGLDQLVRESSFGAAVPIADHVVGLGFELFADPEPPRTRLGDAGEVETTYGPAPPAAGEQQAPHPPGENCIFAWAGSVHVPKLPTLVPIDGPLVKLTEAQLSDGPWCPDAVHPLRFDADLFRVRRVSARVRVQSAIAALRGPIGPMFVHGGSASDPGRFLPDIEGRVTVSPINLLLVGP